MISFRVGAGIPRSRSFPPFARSRPSYFLSTYFFRGGKNVLSWSFHLESSTTGSACRRGLFFTAITAEKDFLFSLSLSLVFREGRKKSRVFSSTNALRKLGKEKEGKNRRKTNEIRPYHVIFFPPHTHQKCFMASHAHKSPSRPFSLSQQTRVRFNPNEILSPLFTPLPDVLPGLTNGATHSVSCCEHFCLSLLFLSTWRGAKDP